MAAQGSRHRPGASVAGGSGRPSVCPLRELGHVPCHCPSRLHPGPTRGSAFVLLAWEPGTQLPPEFASWLTSEYWLAMLKLWWLYDKNCLNFVLSRVRGTGSFRAAIHGPLTIQTHLSKVFLLYFWRSLDNHVFVYYTGHFLTQHIAGFWFMYLHKTLKVFCSESNLV